MGMIVGWMQSYYLVTGRVGGGVAFLPPRESCLGYVDFSSEPLFHFTLVTCSPGSRTTVYFRPQSVGLLAPHYIKACYESEIVPGDVHARTRSPRLHCNPLGCCGPYTNPGFLFAVLRGRVAGLSKTLEFRSSLLGNISIPPAPQVRCQLSLSIPGPVAEWCHRSG